MRDFLNYSAVLILGVSALSVSAAQADDWVVARLRGTVSVFDGGTWQVLDRGSVVDDHRRIKSADGSHVVFTRGQESIELTGATEIRIYDQAGQRMTTVMQAYGTVAIEAEHLNVQHFSVQTPYLAAIVKGTRFTVTSDEDGSEVAVDRGIVQVQDTVHDVIANVVQGQDAAVSETVVLDITGSGRIPPIATMQGVVLAQDEIAILRGSAAGTTPPTSSEAAPLKEQSSDNGHSDNGNGHSGEGNSGHGNGNSGSGENGNSGNGNGHSDNQNGNGNSGNGNNGNTDRGNSGNGNSDHEDGHSNNGNNGNGNSGNENHENSGNNGNGSNNSRNSHGRDD